MGHRCTACLAVTEPSNGRVLRLGQGCTACLTVTEPSNSGVLQLGQGCTACLTVTWHLHVWQTGPQISCMLLQWHRGSMDTQVSVTTDMNYFRVGVWLSGRALESWSDDSGFNISAGGTSSSLVIVAAALLGQRGRRNVSEFTVVTVCTVEYLCNS